MKDFLEKVGVLKKSPPPPANTVSKPAVQKPVMDSITVPVDENIKPSVDYSSFLKNELVKVNIPGPDYLEFAEALKNVEADIPESQRFKMIFVSFKSMGVTADKLISTARNYVSHLNSVKSNFFESLKNEKKAGVDDLNDQVSKWRKDVEELNKKIAQTEKKSKENSLVLAVEEAAFNKAFQNEQEKIEENIDKISKYIKNESTQSQQ